MYSTIDVTFVLYLLHKVLGQQGTAGEILPHAVLGVCVKLLPVGGRGGERRLQPLHQRHSFPGRFLLHHRGVCVCVMRETARRCFVH